ncbi:MAG: 2-C-methyl-D-erythritol 2,4-cyclodiphosphate synthase [Lachnospiraceae bacterium]|nr:2-C-methyl-D-erythritol 2,4-cyclodiphosphate synthase [Lachnospiraceae bacterium]
MRIGQGYDVHKLVEGRALILGGVAVPYEKGLLGHSDADVLTHAVMDALLGAAALGDIGSNFPDSDDKYKGISSLSLLNEVRDMLLNNLFIVENIDATIIAQKPKLSTYIREMRENIANTLKIDISQVSIKATTEEGLGFTGAGEGIAAQAVCLLESARNLDYGAGNSGVYDYESADAMNSQGISGKSCTGCPGCCKR